MSWVCVNRANCVYMKYAVNTYVYCACQPASQRIGLRGSHSNRLKILIIKREEFDVAIIRYFRKYMHTEFNTLQLESHRQTTHTLYLRACLFGVEV